MRLIRMSFQRGRIPDPGLAPGGTFIQWVPDYLFSKPAFLMVIRSFTSVFGDTTLWRLNKDDLVLMYQKEPSQTNEWIYDRLAEEALKYTLDQVSDLTPEELVDMRLADEDVVANLALSGEVHSLNRPRLGETVLRVLYQLDPEYSVEKLIKKTQLGVPPPES